VYRKVPAGWSAPLVGAGYFGGHRAPSLIEHRAVGLMLVTGLIPTGRISSNEPWTWSATLEVGSVKTFGEASSGRLTCFRGVQRDFQFAFIHGTIVPLKRKRSARRSPASREFVLRVRSDFWV